MRMRLFPAVIATIALLLGGQLPARTIFPPVGSPGGSAWDDHCPQNRFLVGLRGRFTPINPRVAMGDHGTINSIRIICASFSAAGNRGALWYGPERGSSGGDYQEFSCSKDAVIMGYNARTKDAKEGVGISSVSALCVSRNNGVRTTIGFGQLGSPARPLETYDGFRGSCPAGESGSGISGRSNGSGVRAVGLDCAIRLPS